MLTARGWWLLVSALFLTGVGVAISIRHGGLLAIAGFSLLTWLMIEAVQFHVRLRWTSKQLNLSRQIRDEHSAVNTLWTHRSFEVEVRVQSSSRLPSPYVIAEDRLPFGVELQGEASPAGTTITRYQPATIRYRIRCHSPGTIRFEGVRLRFADLQGFFFHETFIRQPLEFPVLPSLKSVDSHQRTKKRHNMLLPPGIHHLRRAGSGSELLDLRDYRPGDPPKMIAWKASARKDKLITKEFESEVPVRCTLFVDCSQAMRLGPPGRNSLSRVIEIAATATQAALSNRDQVGLVLFDEAERSYLAPKRGQRHLMDVLRRLGSVAKLPPTAPTGDMRPLLEIAHAFAHEVYPDLLQKDINHLPWWVPILYPRPEWLRKLTLTDAVMPWWRRFSPSEWREMDLRKRLSVVLAWQQGIAPGGLAQLLEDDALFMESLQRFLTDHRIPFPVPLYDWRGNYVFADPLKIDQLSEALVATVRRARDNELFVIFADLFEHGPHLEPLRNAVKVALGRHHRVLLVAPWNPDFPPPGEAQARPKRDDDVIGLLRQATIERYHRAFEFVRKEFGRLGVQVVCAQSSEPTELILERMEQLRLGGIRR
jgi:uncharacterized protein (DUF58 family)